jgi:hypothetical protein
VPIDGLAIGDWRSTDCRVAIGLVGDFALVNHSSIVNRSIGTRPLVNHSSIVNPSIGTRALATASIANRQSAVGN